MVPIGFKGITFQLAMPKLLFAVLLTILSLFPDRKECSAAEVCIQLKSLQGKWYLLASSRPDFKDINSTPAVFISLKKNDTSADVSAELLFKDKSRQYTMQYTLFLKDTAVLKTENGVTTVCRVLTLDSSLQTLVFIDKNKEDTREIISILSRSTQLSKGDLQGVIKAIDTSAKDPQEVEKLNWFQAKKPCTNCLR